MFKHCMYLVSQQVLVGKLLLIFFFFFFFQKFRQIEETSAVCTV